MSQDENRTSDAEAPARLNIELAKLTFSIDGAAKIIGEIRHDVGELRADVRAQGERSARLEAVGESLKDLPERVSALEARRGSVSALERRVAKLEANNHHKRPDAEGLETPSARGKRLLEWSKKQGTIIGGIVLGIMAVLVALQEPIRWIVAKLTGHPFLPGPPPPGPGTGP